MYVHMISFEISSSPCTPGITNEPLCGVHDALPFGLGYLLSCHFEDREFRSSPVVYYPSEYIKSVLYAPSSLLSLSTLLALL